MKASKYRETGKKGLFEEEETLNKLSAIHKETLKK
jgi:hypothetical protein